MPGTVIIHDTFTDDDDIELWSHDADVGGNWQWSGSSGGTRILGNTLHVSFGSQASLPITIYYLILASESLPHLLRMSLEFMHVPQTAPHQLSQLFSPVPLDVNNGYTTGAYVASFGETAVISAGVTDVPIDNNTVYSLVAEYNGVEQMARFYLDDNEVSSFSVTSETMQTWFKYGFYHQKVGNQPNATIVVDNFTVTRDVISGGSPRITSRIVSPIISGI